MAIRKKAKDTAKTASRFILGKIFGRSFFVIFLLICGGIIFNLDRITGNDNFRNYLPGFITRWLPAASRTGDTGKTISQTQPGSENTVIGKVTSVYDGDTLTLAGNNAKNIKSVFSELMLRKQSRNMVSWQEILYGKKC